MTTDRPLFSVITVTYNAAATIARTLASVKAQSHKFMEYIVVDGASADNTLELVKEAGIPNTRIVSEPDNGLYDAMNKGRDMAEGDYLIFLNAGDAFHSPDIIEKLAVAALDNDFPGIIYGQTDIVDNAGRRLAGRHLEAPASLSLDSFKDGMVVCHQAFIALKKISSKFDTKYRFSADYEWCIRCLQHSRHNVYLDEVLIDYLAEGVSTKNRRASLKERFKIMSFYYGFWPTVIRHARFIPRFLRRRRLEKEFQCL